MNELDRNCSTFQEPIVTPSILAGIPDCLRNIIRENIKRSTEKRPSILVSSNTLANRFIFERWGIRSSQRRRYKNLYSKIRQQCRAIFRNYLARGKLAWKDQRDEIVVGVFKFGEVRGNLILGFVLSYGYLDLKRGSDDM